MMMMIIMNYKGDEEGKERPGGESVSKFQGMALQPSGSQLSGRYRWRCMDCVVKEYSLWPG